MKLTFMGAGSTVFSKNVLGDTMLCDAFHDVDVSRNCVPEKIKEIAADIRGVNSKMK